MSSIHNERLAENLFDRLEKLEPVLNIYQYAQMQQDLLQMFVRGEFEEASQAVIKWEQDYCGSVPSKVAQEALSDDTY